MKYNIGDKMHGFVVKKSKSVKEIGGDIYILRHEKSGAKLCYIDCDDRNMTYAVTFPTPSHDSTGVFHILEHSVLCGSEKYPVGDPFVELMKSSLYTFLNAMTFPDKTMYPVSSQNEKDLMNLMSVYTDAVFRPLIYRDETAFRQEGWHIETDPDGKPYYQGVVYNEMKGALSDPEDILYTAVFRESFKECQYTTVSGGHPDAIIKLTYDDFIAAHKRYYHPSNAHFYLYGKMDIGEKLAFLDSEYLSDIEAIEPTVEPHVEIKKQDEPRHEYYTAHEIKEGEDYITLTYPIGYMPDLTAMLSLQVLGSILTESNYSPLKKRLLDKGLAVEVDCSVVEDLCYPLLTIKLQNTYADKLNEIRCEIRDCLRELYENGIERDVVLSHLSTAEFELREGASSGLSKGLIYGIQIAGCWVYDEAPWMYLEYENALKKIKEQLDDRYFERLIERYILQNEFENIVYMTPRIEENKYSSPTDLPDDYKAEPIDPESKEVPHLDLADVDPKVIPDSCEKIEKDGKTILYHELKTDGIVYTNLLYDIGEADDNELFALVILTQLLSNLPTKAHSGKELQTLLGLYTGSLDLSNIAVKADDNAYAVCALRFKALGEKFCDALALAREIASSTLIEDKALIKDIINQTFTDLQLSLINNSGQTAMGRAAGTYSVADALSDKMRGLTAYENLRALHDDLDNRIDSVIADVRAVYEKYIIGGKCVLSVACDRETFDKLPDFSVTENAVTALTPTQTPLLSGSLALSAPTDIVFNGYSADIADESISAGAMIASKKILSLEYLWQTIRVENGAYGCGATPTRFRRLDFWSYRDPQIGSTLDCYRKAADFLSTLSLSDRQMEDYIIGCIRTLDTPTPPSHKALLSDIMFLSGRTDADRQRDRDELLSVTLKDVRHVGEAAKKYMDAAPYCTVGNAENIERNRDLFDRIEKM